MNPVMARNRLGERVIVLSVVINIVVTVAVILRFLARRKSKADVAIDDVLLVVSVIPQYVMVVLGVLGPSSDLRINFLLTTDSGPQGRDGATLRNTFEISGRSFLEGILRSNDELRFFAC
jgi:hypothetical protein